MQISGDWQLRGSCRGTDSDLFFHPEGERGQARSSREESAKEVCLHCPVCQAVPRAPDLKVDAAMACGAG